MRASLLKSSLVLLTAFLICGKTASISYCQQFITYLQPAFISGLLMDEHIRHTIIADVVTKKDSGNTTNPTAEKKQPEELINYLLKKNAPENKELVVKEKTQLISDSTSEITKTQPSTAIPAKQIEVPATAKTQEENSPLIEEEVDPLINKYAEMISVEPQDISNYPLYRFIDKWYGTRYKWGGMDSTGIDCSAFSQRLYGTIYGTDIDRTAREQHHSADHIKHYLDASEGDLIFFRIHRLRISHVGVYLANGYFVHASRSHGVMISSMNDKYWSRRYAGCGRVEREGKRMSESDFLQ